MTNFWQYSTNIRVNYEMASQRGKR